MTTFIPSLTLPHHIFASPAASILLPIAAGTFVGFAVSSEKTRTTYKELRQPPLAPPPWVFGPAWTCLYASMGYAAYRAWTVGVNNFDVEKVAMARVMTPQVQRYCECLSADLVCSTAPRSTPFRWASI